MPRLARIAFLKGTELFVGFGADELAQLAAVCVPVRFATGEHLFRAGDPAGELYILISGRVERISGDVPDRWAEALPAEELPSGGGVRPGPVRVAGELTAGPPALLGPEEVVGELGLFDGLPRPESARAREPVEALSLARADLIEVLSQAPLLALALLRIMSRRLRAGPEPHRASGDPGDPGP